MKAELSNPKEFQSLIGILVGFNSKKSPQPNGSVLVSIPDRDFSWFQLIVIKSYLRGDRFQSLIGILVGFNKMYCSFGFEGT